MTGETATPITLETINAKLDQLAALLAAAGVAVPAKAYERPVLTVDQVTVDGKTVNPDGSIWGVSFYDGKAGPPTQEYFGYISPVKTPEIWAWAKAHLTPEVYARWDDAWRANPYGIYKADIREYIKNGTATFMLFDLAYDRPARTVVQ